ncbi:RGS1-HXK1-interacting protein 1 [Nymphaea colorata]|nr:RGS1-HXK1-interacting protein 1 [Nymphaea colorata]
MAEGEGKSPASSGEALISGGRSSAELKPWIEYAVEQAESFGRTMQETADSAVVSARSRLLELHAISSDLLNRSSEVYASLKAGFDLYENAAFGLLKDGLFVAADHPSITLGVAAGSSLLALKRPRRFLLRRASRLFVSEESMISNAEEKVKQLRQSVELVKNESKKLEERAKLAEEEMKRGQLKLRQAGHQIQGVIRSVDKIERQVRGLKDVLGELPRVEASRFRSQVSSISSEAKREKNALAKAVTKISNYGISV